MTDILEYISTWSVLKWVVLVLVAGFIGQFGRMLAEAMIARVRLRRAKRDSSLPPDDQQKQEATAVIPIETSVPELTAKPAAPVEVPDKKLLKAMAKARKKEAKKKSL
jgi:hypothetical protein